MEAEVYAYGPDKVLKLYAGTTDFADLLLLKAFYEDLPQQLVPYALPHILTVVCEEDCTVMIEKRLSGTPMSVGLPSLALDKIDTLMERYLTAALDLSEIQAPPEFDRYKLFDPNQLSQKERGDWHVFLKRYLDDKLAQVAPCLSRDVAQFAEKVQRL